VQASLVRISKPTQRSKLVGSKVATVVLENKFVVTLGDLNPSCAGIVGILQHLGYNMTRTLNLAEELPPRSRNLRPALELLPNFP
jgi:hypothetical protein